MRQTCREAGTQSLRSRVVETRDSGVAGERLLRRATVVIPYPLRRRVDFFWSAGGEATRVGVGQMHYFPRRDAALLARYFLCATLATVLSACGGSGDSTNPYSA